MINHTESEFMFGWGVVPVLQQGTPPHHGSVAALQNVDWLAFNLHQPAW